MPKSDAKHGTIALFVASAVLATFGVALLVEGGTKRPDTTLSTPTTTANSAAAVDREPTAPTPAATQTLAATPAPTASPSPASSSPEPAGPAAPAPVPEPIQEAARAFATAWASHDARPGRDTSYDDASRRAAAYADGPLADDLRTRTSGSAGAQQWRSWQSGQVQVSVSVLQISLPDGAPAPTQDLGFARVIYKVTETPASGAAVESEQHVALKLRRGGDGTWRVVGLPNV